MTQHEPLLADPQAGGPEPQLARLRAALALVTRMAGEDAPPGAADDLDQAARLALAYADAPPITRRRYDTLASETAAFAAAGIEALLPRTAHPAAARRLATELRGALGDMARIIGCRGYGFVFASGAKQSSLPESDRHGAGAPRDDETCG